MAQWVPSPNHEPRVQPVKFIIIHGTWMDDDQAALARLCDPVAKVSCHYMIDRQGKLYQLVADDQVAWHAGQSAWGLDTSLNAHSIGIEIGNSGETSGEAYNEAQYQTLETLLAELLKRHNLKPVAVLGHSDIAPHRKDDPGRHFNWQRLEAKGLAQPWPGNHELAADPVTTLRHFGYVGDDIAILTAFQRRYLPQHITGHLCPVTEAFIRQGCIG